MGKHLFPDEYRMSVWDIDLEALAERGITGIILDIDNTLVPYFVQDPPKELRKWILDLKEKGFDAYIVSNGKRERVERFNLSLKLPFICHAKKPSAAGFQAALTKLNKKPEEMAVIGDQIFTDVWGGNRMGMHTIMVHQVSPRDELITAVKRPLEKIVLLFYKHRCKKNLQKENRS